MGVKEVEEEERGQERHGLGLENEDHGGERAIFEYKEVYGIEHTRNKHVGQAEILLVTCVKGLYDGIDVGLDYHRLKNNKELTFFIGLTVDFEY